MTTTTAPDLAKLTGPAGELGEARHPDDLPGWAKATRDALDRYDGKYFEGSGGVWIWQANSHELIAMIEEIRDFPDALWEKLVAE